MMRIQQRNKLFTLIAVLVLLALACSSITIGNPGTDDNNDEGPVVVTVEVVVTNTPDPAADTPTESTDDSSSDDTSDTTGPPTAVLNQDLNVRGGPGTEYDSYGALPGGSEVEILGQYGNPPWFQIQFGNALGWVSAPFTTYGDISGVPVVQPPPPPSNSNSNSNSNGNGNGNNNNGNNNNGNNNNNNNNGGGNNGNTANNDNDNNYRASLNFKQNQTAFFNSDVSYPNGDTQDVVYYDITGFDSVNTTANSVITVNCTGPNAGDVKLKFRNTPATVSCPASHDYFHNEYNKNGGVTIWLDGPNGAYAQWSVVISTSD